MHLVIYVDNLECVGNGKIIEESLLWLDFNWNNQHPTQPYIYTESTPKAKRRIQTN